MEETTERSVEIVPFGTDERIKLNVGMIQKMIAVPTKSGHIADAVSCMKFMMLCKARHLNPFEGDAYLIGFDTQDGPQFSLITAHQVFLKRAEASESFDGMESGVVVAAIDDLHIIEEREGDIVYEDEKLIGGWAKVYRKDRKIPFYKRLKLSTFNTGRSRWAKDAPGMIVKCTEADALRTAFPTHLGGLYMREELEPIDITPKNGDGIKFGPAIPEQDLSGGVEQVQDTRLAPSIEPGRSDGESELESREVVAPPAQKRRRRTKAEMEAARTAQVPETNEDSSTAAAEETRHAGAQAETAAEQTPQRATPLEGLRNLINATPITEFQLENWCRRKGMLEAHQNIANLTPDNMAEVIGDFNRIVNSIADGTDIG